MVIFKTESGGKIVCDPAKDEQIYDAPNNPPNTGTRYTRGSDIYMHESPWGEKHFYSYDWSMWQGEESTYNLMSFEDVSEFLIERMSGDYHIRPSDSEIKRAQELGLLPTEDARGA